MTYSDNIKSLLYQSILSAWLLFVCFSFRLNNKHVLFIQCLLYAAVQISYKRLLYLYMLYELRYLPESTSSTPQQLLHFITFTAACPDDHGTNKKKEQPCALGVTV